MARSIENSASSLRPLVEEGSRESHLLNAVAEQAQSISLELTELYNGIARKAFGPESGK